MTTNGLEGVVVADTELSAVDGEAGELLLRGLPVGEVAGRLRFEEVCRLMWEGDPSRGAPVDLGPARVRAYAKLGSLGDALAAPDAMDALRAAMAHLTSTGGVAPTREEVTAAVAVYAAAWSRVARGLDPIAPDPGLGHAADYLRMVHGKLPSERAVAAMDAYFATVVDHGMTASTFAGRVIASAESRLLSAGGGAAGASAAA